MKKISNEQIELITAASAEGFTDYPIAALEKDIHITNVLEIFSKFPIPGFELTFGGGTSLVKGYGLFERMSEDMDFKLNPLGDFSEVNTRKRFAMAKNQTLEIFENHDFVVTTLFAGNNNQSFSLELEYEHAFAAASNLRPHIRLEFTHSQNFLSPVLCRIQTLLDEAIGQQGKVLEFSCVNKNQTAFEKVLGFLSRYEPDYASRKIGYDERIVRHIHDIYYLTQREENFKQEMHVFGRVLAEDEVKFSGRNKNFDENPKNYLTSSLVSIRADLELASAYSSFVDTLTIGPSPTFEESLERFITVASRCIQSLD